jgi:hypothetical protein
MLTVFIGATFQLVGNLNMDGATADFTGWTLTANLYDSAGANEISPLSVIWEDSTQGLFTLTAQSTSNWPATKARIDFRLVSPAGDVILGPPAYLRIAQSPMS